MRWLHGSLLLSGLAFASASGCDSKPRPDEAPSSPGSARAPVASAEGDQLPALEVEPASAPPYSVAKLTDHQLTALLAKNGWTATSVGKSSGDGGGSAIRAAAFKKQGDGNLECTVTVRCAAAGAAAPPVSEHKPGEAYFTQAPCELKVEVRRGIRKKSAESKLLLEQLLGTKPG